MIKLLITGEMRSGTTLLANFLDAQENFTIYRDFLHIDRLRGRIGVTSTIENLTTLQKTRLIYSFNYDDNAKLGFTVDLLPTEFSNLIEFYQNILEKITQPEDVVVGHKTTRAYAIVDELVKFVPDFKVIFVLRDPRDVVSSAIERWGNMHDRSVFHYIENWLQSWTVIEKYKHDHKLASKVFVLRYEDLVLHTDRTLLHVAQFLGVGKLTVPKMMNDYGSDWFHNSSFGELEGIFDPSPIGRWRDRNSRFGRVSEVLLLERMRDAGYEASERISGFEKTRVKVRYFLYRLVRKVPMLFRLLESRILIPLQKRLIRF